MGIGTYAELKQSVYDWLLRDSTTDIVITNERVETYIALAEAKLSRDLKVRELETEDDTLETVADASTIALPTDYRNMISLEFDGSPKDIEYIPENMIAKIYRRGSKGRPKSFTVQGDYLRFAPIPDSAYGMYMRYYKGVTPLSDSNTTSTILTKYPDAYLYGTLVQALLNINDTERLSTNKSIYDGVIREINKENQNSQIPSGVRMRSTKPIG